MKKKVLILGANSDMGKSIAEVYAKNGYDLILLSRNLNELNELSNHLNIFKDLNIEFLYFDALDLANINNVLAGIDFDNIEGVISCFGVMFDGLEMEDSSNELSEKIITTVNTNYTANIICLEYVSKIFEKRKYGFIVGISSVAGDRGRMSNYIYGSSKSAFNTYLEGLRHKMAKNYVNVLTVKPGFVYTKMTKHLKLPSILTAKPIEVAEKIFKAVKNNKSVIYVRPIWKYIMLTIKNIPDFIFHKTKL